jgi:hypothetical protein
MLEELFRLTHGKETIPLQKKHVKHLSVTAKALLKRHAASEVIAIALPPLVCKKRCHYAHIYIKGHIDYRGATSIDYPLSSGELRCGDVREKGRYYMKDAIEYAENLWGDELRDADNWTHVQKSVSNDHLQTRIWIVLAEDKQYQTSSQCEALELCYKKKVRYL